MDAARCGEEPSATKKSRRQLGAYRLTSKIGEGGMGSVYRAVHATLEKVVALKVLTRNRARSRLAIARFQREIRTTARFDHPNVIWASDAGDIDGQHFLVMEHVDGLNLSQLVARCGPLSVANACEIVRQAALGLEHIHQCGAIHRDVKPANAMLTRQGQVKIIDLGLALSNGDDRDRDDCSDSQELVGSLDYIAPEQAHNSSAVSVAVDLYGLGATLFQLLSGKPPFAGADFDSPLKKLIAIAARPAPSVHEYRPEVPFELEKIVARLLAKDPGDRFASAAELAAAIAPYSMCSDLPGLATVAGARPSSQEVVNNSTCSTSSCVSSITIDYVPAALPENQVSQPLSRRDIRQ
jgi:serine/threonine protein kinase